MTVDTKPFEIQPLLGDALPEAAVFLDRWRSDGDHGPPGSRPAGAASPSTERHLQWLLVENPVGAAASQYGLCIRDASGGMAGLLVSFPSAFRAEDRRLLGLCSGSYFVEPRARTLGFFLFKRHLHHRDYAFFFSTTCNAESGALWRLLGGEPVPECDAEYVLPLDFQVVLPAFLATRTSRAWAAALARLAGRCANGAARLARTASALTSAPCRDWEKLAELSRRHRPSEWITTDRTAAFLEWCYGPGSPHHASDIRVFRDTRGNEGWFVLDDTVRGDRPRIDGRILLDATWPRDTIGFDQVLATIASSAGSQVHAIYFRPRPGVDYGPLRGRIIRRRREPASVFALAGRGLAPARVSALDLVLADGDGGFADEARDDTTFELGHRQ